MNNPAWIAVLAFILIQSTNEPLPDMPELWQRVRPNLLQQYDPGNLLKDYTYLMSTTRDQLDDRGVVKESERLEFEVYYLDQGPFGKLIRRNGKPLAAKEAKRQDEKFEKYKKKKPRSGVMPWNRKRTAAERAEQLDDVYAAFDFEVVGREIHDGRSTIAVVFKPRISPKLKTMVARMMFTKMEGAAWIDEQDSRLSKIHIRFIKDVKVAFGLLASISKDTEITQEWKKVNGEIWFPLHTEMRFKGRIMLAKVYSMRVSSDFSDYKKFTVETNIKLSGSSP